MEIAILCLLCLVIGWYAREKYAIYKTKLFFDSMEAQNEEPEDNIKSIVIEKQEGIFLVYSRDDNTFMAQGSSIEELEDNLATRYPGTRFGASPENLKTVGIIK